MAMHSINTVSLSSLVASSPQNERRSAVWFTPASANHPTNEPQESEWMLMNNAYRSLVLAATVLLAVLLTSLSTPSAGLSLWANATQPTQSVIGTGGA